MLKTVFIGSKNEFNEVLVHWLAQRTEVAGVVWTSSTAWQRTWGGRLRFALRRFRRYGLLKVINETLFFLYYHAYLSSQDEEEKYEQIIKPYRARHGEVAWGGDSIRTADVNSPEVISFLEERRPDVALAMCINNYFGKKLRSVPRLGVLLWHEGITPEYKGLYSPFWAVHNLDFERIGYTVLQMNDKYDAGTIYVQGAARGVDPLRHNHGYIGHNAVIDSLPQVEKALAALEGGTLKPIQRPEAKPGNYTYPGITDFIRLRLRLWRLARAQSVTA